MSLWRDFANRGKGLAADPQKTILLRLRLRLARALYGSRIANLPSLSRGIAVRPETSIRFSGRRPHEGSEQELFRFVR